MTRTELKKSIVDELTVELKDEPTFSAEILEIKVDGAIREVIRARRYPPLYTEAMIDSDLTGFYQNIKNIAMYDFNQIGAEFQSSSSENGENRQYTDRNKLFYGIIPFAR